MFRNLQDYKGIKKIISNSLNISRDNSSGYVLCLSNGYKMRISFIGENNINCWCFYKEMWVYEKNIKFISKWQRHDLEQHINTRKAYLDYHKNTQVCRPFYWESGVRERRR